METIEPSGSAFRDTEHEPNFLLVRDTSGDWPRWKRAALGSVVFHLVGITALFLIKAESYQPPPPERIEPQHIVHLFIPKDLTQKAPNKGPVSKLILSQNSAPAPKLPPAPAPKIAKQAPPLPPASPPSQPKPTIIQPPVSPEPNPGEIARNQPAGGTLPPVTLPKPEAPKIVIDDAPSLHPAPRIGNFNRPPNPSEDAIRNMRSGGAPIGSRSGESDLTTAGGVHIPPSVARASSPQLKSDPMGVDFSAYLQQVLTAVKLNWSAVFPTAARLGQRGIVSIEFAIAKDGSVTKIVFESQSGARVLDNASVAAISASNPLPPLPKDFKGDRIVLQMSFMYNIPRQ
ncbi:MAG TPA: TonB family protein [Bryobacteraceae bacterium]|jgi:TonB family protein